MALNQPVDCAVLYCSVTSAGMQLIHKQVMYATVKLKLWIIFCWPRCAVAACKPVEGSFWRCRCISQSLSVQSELIALSWRGIYLPFCPPGLDLAIESSTRLDMGRS